MKREIKTSIKKIAKYWMNNHTVCETELNFDWADAETHCWNCGDDKLSTDGKAVRVERAHIVPDALGGKDEPSNYVLLCNQCHKEAPNSANPEYMWEWLKSNKNPFGFYGTYRIVKGMELFEKRKGRKFGELVAEKANQLGNINEVLANEYKKINTHGFSVNTETMYALLCEVEKYYLTV